MLICKQTKWFLLWWLSHEGWNQTKTWALVSEFQCHEVGTIFFFFNWMSLAHMSDPDYSKILVLNPAITNSSWVKKKRKKERKIWTGHIDCDYFLRMYPPIASITHARVKPHDPSSTAMTLNVQGIKTPVVLYPRPATWFFFGCLGKERFQANSDCCNLYVDLAISGKAK